MALTGKTTSKYVTVTYNSQAVTCSIDNITGLGISYQEVDVTTLCKAIAENVNGVGTVAISVSGPLDNTASTGGHTVFAAANGVQTGYALVVVFGIRAAPSGGEPTFTVSLAMTTSYVVSAGGGNVTYSATLKPAVGSTAVWS